MSGCRAVYFDGRTAARHDVALTLGVHGLQIHGQTGLIASWPLGEISFLAAARPGEPTRVKHADDDARLVIDDPAFVAALRRVPGLGQAQSRHRRRRDLRLVIVVATLGVILAGAVVGVRSVPEFVGRLVPAAWEQGVGDRLMPQFIAFFAELEGGEPRLCAAPEGRRALDEMLRRLAVPSAHAIRLEVADVKMVNAIALPGGRVVLFRGLIDEAKSAEEVTGVLAHEIGHTLHYHPMQQLFRQLGVSLLLRVVLADLGGGSVLGKMAELAVALSYSREAEAEADAAAARHLREAGVPTVPLADFFDRLAAREKAQPGIMQMLSTHPASESRARLFREESKSGVGPVLSARDWAALRAICDVRAPIEASPATIGGASPPRP